MNFRIVGDSCTDFLPEDLEKEYIVSVPLTITIGDTEIVDDETFDQKDFLQRVAEYPECPKSACPSPEMYMECFEGADMVFVVTLSGQLSGSYNSAMLAKSMYEEQHPEVLIHVFDSESASCGQYLIARLIEQYALQGMAFADIVEKVTTFRDEMQTLFVLESLETLRKNGRLSKVKALAAAALNIKPYMKAEEGNILQVGQARGVKQAIGKMIDYIEQIGKYLEDKVIVIAHCNCLERAQFVKTKVMERYPFQEAIVIDTKGISSLYASDGGVILSF